jgi:hypothetical protein
MIVKRIFSRRIDREINHSNAKIVLLIGQRRVGKTVELKRLQANHENSRYIDFEDYATRQLFEPSLVVLERLIGSPTDKRLLLLDEIQYVPQIGAILKLIHDHFKSTRVVASGSASFLMLRNIGDSLAGRSITIDAHPLLPREMAGDADNARFALGDYDGLLNRPFIETNMESWLLHGSLPEIWFEPNIERKEILLKSYVNSLMFKDIFEIEGIRSPDAMQKLVRLLALQIGSELNPNELATTLNINRRTVVEYINVLEKFRLVRVLTAFSGNLRNEISRGFKVYFTDLGVRNALLGNFVPMSGRTDAGAMFENFVINLISNNIDAFQQPESVFFWRSKQQSEVDLVISDQRTGKLTPIEIKLTQKAKIARSFLDSYRDRIDKAFVVNRDNIWQFA